MTAAAAHIPIVPPAREIPTTFSASFRAWWSSGTKGSALSEERLLRRLPYFASANEPAPQHAYPVTARVGPVQLNDPKHFINTLTFTPARPRSDAPPPTVILHGYGAGLGFFFKNYDALGSWAGRRGATVYALDWLGMGRSSRPPFRVTAKKADIDGRVSQAEAFFVDSLEQWRKKMGIEKMTLVGHSLGAYMSTVYSLRYPEHVHKIILLSPAGVPHDSDASVPTQEVDPSPKTRDNARAPPAQPATADKVKAVRAEQGRQRERQSTFRRVAFYLWEEGYSPFQVVRSMSFMGPWLVGKYSSRRFTGMSQQEIEDMNDYILNITVAKGSSEYCISHILSPGAFARRPLVDRISKLRMPVTFVYGDHDWMDPAGGTESVRKLKSTGNRNARMYIVPNAGHHLYLDNPQATDDLLIAELDEHAGRA